MSKCHYFEFAGTLKDYLQTPICVILNLESRCVFSKFEHIYFPLVLKQKISYHLYDFK